MASKARYATASIIVALVLALIIGSVLVGTARRQANRDLPQKVASAMRRAPAAKKPTETKGAVPPASAKRARRAPAGTPPKPGTSHAKSGAIEQSAVDNIMNGAGNGTTAPKSGKTLDFGLDRATRTAIANAAVGTLKKMAKGNAVAAGLTDPTIIEWALASLRVKRIERKGSTARITVGGGPVKRAAVRMKLRRGHWRVVALESYQTK